MTLLSLFMTSTGIFCFVPISQRLVESGITPASDGWRLLSLLIPYGQTEDKDRVLCSSDVKNAWSGTEHHEICSHDPPMLQLLYLEDETFVMDQLPVVKTQDEWSSCMTSPSQCMTADSRFHSPSIDTAYGCAPASFFDVTFPIIFKSTQDSDSTLCDSCSSLLRQEIPPDHIPSVIRALALFEAQEQLYVGFSEYDIVALTDAFSMLRL